MMKVDSQLVSCPPGRTRSPLCDQGNFLEDKSLIEGLECPSGRWGFACQGSCHCAGNLPCDPVTGICSNGKCDAGWEGDLCKEGLPFLTVLNEQLDIDECSSEIVICGEHSECINQDGGYECRCVPGYSKNGSQCQLFDQCQQHFERPCSPDASCQIKASRPSCICKDGLIGDGFHCEARASLPVIDLTREILLPSLEGLPPVDPEEAKEIGETPFVMQTWLPTQTTPPSKRPLIVTAPPVVATPRNVTVVKEAQENVSNLCKFD